MPPSPSTGAIFTPGTCWLSQRSPSVPRPSIRQNSNSSNGGSPSQMKPCSQGASPVNPHCAPPEPSPDGVQKLSIPWLRHRPSEHAASSGAPQRAPRVPSPAARHFAKSALPPQVKPPWHAASPAAPQSEPELPSPSGSQRSPMLSCSRHTKPPPHGASTGSSQKSRTLPSPGAEHAWPVSVRRHTSPGSQGESPAAPQGEDSCPVPFSEQNNAPGDPSELLHPSTHRQLDIASQGASPGAPHSAVPSPSRSQKPIPPD